MKQLKKIAIFLFAPSAFKIGLVMTFGFVYLAFSYYTTPVKRYGPILNAIEDIHSQTIDYRLRARGPRKVSDEIVLLAVDDKALEKLGRWPWPRTKIADMIERLRSYGAKVIAFDAVFSEPEVNLATRTLTEIKNSGLASPELSEVIDKQLEANNSDVILAKTVEKHSDFLVMGTYFDTAGKYENPSSDLCEAEFIAKESEYKTLENEAFPVVALDTNSVELLPEMKAFIDTNFDRIKQNAIAKAQTESITDAAAIESMIKTENAQFCNTWLEDYIQNQETQQRGLASSTNLDDFLASLLSNPVEKAFKFWLNTPVIAQGTKHTGYFNAFQDKDGTVRGANLIARQGNQYVPSIGLKTIMLAKNLGVLIKLETDEQNPQFKKISSLTLTDAETAEEVKSIPVDSEGKMLINYAGTNHSYPYLSVAELFNNKDTAQVLQLQDNEQQTREVNKAEWLKNKIFLFGATAIGIYDLRVTPLGENFPGPEIHTNIMDNLLQEDYLQKSSTEPIKMFGVLIIVGLVLSGLISYLGAVVGMLITVGTLGGVYFYDKIFLFQNGLVTTIVFPIILICSLYVVLTFYKYLTEERKKNELKGTFAKYVSPSVVNEILKDPGNIELGGKKQRMTVMFSDVRGFTTISEKLEPTKLGDILNMYLTPMTRLVFEYKGTLDKYMGDAIMAFWGAPIAFPDHTIQASRYALKMMEQLKTLNEEFAKLQLPPIDIGIGINTGDMSVGNMGSDIVRSYTVMGDSVNLGSRLEGINKEYGTKIIISEFTYQEVKDHFVCREIDWVRVKGKNQPVRIFELIAEKAAVDKFAAKVQNFSAGFDFYHQKMWDKAIEAFNLTLNVAPDDYATKMYLKRCTNYKNEPPPEDWDGVFEMKTK